MARVFAIAQETPCVRCGHVPTVAFAWAGVEESTGRVCADHAEKLASKGVCVAGDNKLLENWGDD